jgi:hypothetical protein
MTGLIIRSWFWAKRGREKKRNSKAPLPTFAVREGMATFSNSFLKFIFIE